MDTTIIVAIISSTVAILGVLVSVFTSRWTIKLHSRELNIKTRELEATSKKMLSDIEAVKQSQLNETIKKRSEFYPKLWSAIREYTTNWDDTQPRDLVWVKDFLASLNKVDTEGGVFFSQAVYEKFHELQLFLFKLKEQLLSSNQEKVGLSDLDFIDAIFRGRPGNLGMAAYLKDDLGNYQDLSIQSRSEHQTTVIFANKLKELTEIVQDPKSVFYKDYSCPPVGASVKEKEQYIDILTLRNELQQISNAVLFRPTVGMVSIESILRKQPEFDRIIKNLHEFITYQVLKKPELHISATESMVLSGLIDSFSLMDLAIKIEDDYSVRLEDKELNTEYFDTLLELSAIVYARKTNKKQTRFFQLPILQRLLRIGRNKVPADQLKPRKRQA